MPDILHRLTINASPEQMHDMVATKTGLERCWSGHPVGGDEKVGDKLLFYFGGDAPSAVMEVVDDLVPTSWSWLTRIGPSERGSWDAEVVCAGVSSAGG